MNWVRAKNSLLLTVRGLPKGIETLPFLEAVQRWLRNHLPMWDKALADLYGLAEFTTLDLAQYPTTLSEFRVPEERAALDRVPPSSASHLSARVRDLFWDGITVYSEISCPQCDNTLKFLQLLASDEIVLCCDICSFSQRTTGEVYVGDSLARPVTKDRLHR